MNIIDVNGIKIGGNHPLILIAGPCVIEEENLVLEIAHEIKEIALKNGIPFIFKSSYEKDNRSSVDLYRGPGIEAGMRILSRVKSKLGVPVISDVHRENDIDIAKEVLDIIQIPAFLSQQTSLLLKAGETNHCINIKKGQFVSPESMQNSVRKVLSTGNQNIILTERGSCFGYNYLVSDITSIPKMQEIGFPVIFDATHIVRKSGIPSDHPEGGEPKYISHLCRAAVAAGCNGLFIETHSNPRDALCDASSMLKLSELDNLLKTIFKISEVVRP